MEEENNQNQSVFKSKIEKKELFEKLLKFPPFYTIQEHKETRKRQLMYWAEITSKYFKENKIQNSSISQLTSPDFTLFQDSSSGTLKKMHKQEILLILEELAQKGSITWKNQDGSKENFTISWFSCFEVADCIDAWAKKNAMSGSIETINFITKGPQTPKDEKFYGMPEEQVVQALYVLEEIGKGEVLEYNNQVTFKFA